MKKLTTELKKLDNILYALASEESYFLSDQNLKNAKFYDENKIDYLINEELIKITSAPICYKLTQKGIVFISNGGFEREQKKQKLNKTSNLVYLLATPIIAFISLVLSIIAISQSNFLNGNKNGYDNFIFQSGVDSLWIVKDTIIGQIEYTEEYSFSKVDSIENKELIKRQTITHAHK